MLQKYAPLIILALFAIGVYFMLHGMNNALEMGKGAVVK
jgi:siderophore synthetase component